MGIAQSFAHDADLDYGVFRGDESAGARLSHLSDQHSASVDLLFAVPRIFGRLDCEQWRASEKGVRVEVRFPNRCRGFQPDQFLSLDDSAGFAARDLPISVLLDLALPVNTPDQPNSIYAGLQFFLLHGECFLPGHVAYSSGSSAGLVLFLPDHLLFGFCAGAIPDVISAKSVTLSTQRLSTCDLLRPAANSPIYGGISRMRDHGTSDWIWIVPSFSGHAGLLCLE